MTHKCVGKLTIIGSDNGLSPGRRQAIIWTNAGILLSGHLGTYFSEKLIKIQTFSLKKIRLKMSSAKCCPFRIGLNVLSIAQRGMNFSIYYWCDVFTIDSYCMFLFNTLKPSQNGRHFPDDILEWIFLNENVWISIEISLKFVPKGQINNIPALVQIMAWRRLGDKPLNEPMMVSLLTHICATRPQWVKNRIDCTEA